MIYVILPPFHSVPMVLIFLNLPCSILPSLSRPSPRSHLIWFPYRGYTYKLAFPLPQLSVLHPSPTRLVLWLLSTTPMAGMSNSWPRPYWKTNCESGPYFLIYLGKHNNNNCYSTHEQYKVNIFRKLTTSIIEYIIICKVFIDLCFSVLKVASSDKVSFISWIYDREWEKWCFI